VQATLFAGKRPYSEARMTVHSERADVGASAESAIDEGGRGRMLVEAPNQAASVQLLWIENAPDVSITNLTLDGAQGSQTARQ
jgi:hypothetical protein